MHRHVLGLSVGLLALTVPSCCSDPVDQSSYFCLGDMSVEEELELGRSYAPNIDATYGGVYADPQAASYLGGLVKEMANRSVYGPGFEWKFTILNTSVPNAFAVPGGYIYITRGLLAAMETEGQFISVMGHELGHVEHRHSHTQMGRQTLASVLVGAGAVGAQIFTDNDTIAAGTAGVLSAGAGVTLLSFSRGQESESDSRGIYYATEMGYDPFEGIKTFEYFEKLEQESGGSTIEFLRTHPLNSTRIEDMKELITTAHPEVVGRPRDSFRPYKQNSHAFADVVQRFKQAQPVYDDYDVAVKDLAEASEGKDKAKVQKALAALEGCASRIPDEALFHTAIGFANLQLGSTKTGQAALKRAISLDNAYLPDRMLYQPHYFLGRSYLDQSTFGPAKTELETSAKAFPYHPASHYYLGQALEELNDNAGAKKAYATCVELDGADGTYGAQAEARAAKL